jgi:flagellar biosynthesis component FlhA
LRRPGRHATLHAGIQQLREALAAERGVTLPPVRMMDDPELADREYAVFIAGEPALRREAPTGHALVGPTDTGRWSGRQTAEPGHDQAVVWLSADEAASAGDGQVVEATEILLANLKRTLQELDPAVLA